MAIGRIFRRPHRLEVRFGPRRLGTASKWHFFAFLEAETPYPTPEYHDLARTGRGESPGSHMDLGHMGFLFCIIVIYFSLRGFSLHSEVCTACLQRVCVSYMVDVSLSA